VLGTGEVLPVVFPVLVDVLVVFPLVDVLVDVLLLLALVVELLLLFTINPVLCIRAGALCAMAPLSVVRNKVARSIVLE